jgi:cytochrome c-type biogenesis protein
MEITLGLAFAAGFISFISPCVLPLVPAYISYMGGRVTNTVAAQAAAGGGTVGTSMFTRMSTGIHSLFFVFGFSLVFVGIGLLSTSFIQVVGGSNINTATAIIGRAGGIVIIVFGLHFMGALSWVFNQLR